MFLPYLNIVFSFVLFLCLFEHYDFVFVLCLWFFYYYFNFVLCYYISIFMLFMCCWIIVVLLFIQVVFSMSMYDTQFPNVVWTGYCVCIVLKKCMYFFKNLHLFMYRRLWLLCYIMDSVCFFSNKTKQLRVSEL